MDKLFVIIPVHNEEKNIITFLKKLKKIAKNIIVVNDGSSDKTLIILKKFSTIHVISLKKNQGKGGAMKVGAELAWKLKAKYIVFMDGDNQHNPFHLTKFMEYFKKGIDVVIGVRVLGSDVPTIRKTGNMFLMFFTTILFGVYISDLICGYRGFTKKGYNQVIWQSLDYGVETETITIIGRKKISFETVVVDTIYLDRYKGVSIKDGLKILLRIPYWRMRDLKKAQLIAKNNFKFEV